WSQLAGSPKVVRWEGPTELDTLESYYFVDNADYYSGTTPADGFTRGLIQVQLNGVIEDRYGYGAMQGAEDRLLATAPDGSGLVFTPFVEEGGGVYFAYFTGSETGDFPITVTFDGQRVRLDGDSAVARLVEPPDHSGAADGQSSASVDPDHGYSPVSASDPPAHPYLDQSEHKEVEVVIEPVGGLRPVVQGLSWAPAPDDQFGGEGLFDVLGFDGGYGAWDSHYRATLKIGSTLPGARRIIVSYQGAAAEPIEIPNADDPSTTVLDLEFGPRLLSPADSTVVVYPSEPEDSPDDPLDQPDGLAVPQPVGGDYQVVVTGWSEDRRYRGVPERGLLRDHPYGAFELQLVSSPYGACGFLEDGQDPDEWPEQNYATVPVGADGRATINVHGFAPGTCVLVVQDWFSFTDAYTNFAGSPKTLRFVAADVGLDRPETWFTVSSAAVPADGNTTGSVTVHLVDPAGGPLDDQASLLEAWGPADSEISVGPFESQGDGLYQAFFTGAKPGDHLIAVKVSGLRVGVKADGGNALAHLTAAGQRVGDEERSWASITAEPGQAGVWGLPGATAADYGQQRITTNVLDADGRPVTGAADKLTVVAAPADPGGALGYSNGGLFECAEALVEGACADGVYTIDVYSGAAVNRALNVVYQDGPADFALSNRDAPLPGSKQLAALFTAAPASGGHSELEVSPTGPLAPGQAFTVTAKLLDRFGNPVEGVPVTFAMFGDSSPAARIVGGQTDHDEEMHFITVDSSDTGSASAQVNAFLAGEQEIEVWFGTDQDGDYIGYTTLTWSWPPGPAVDTSKSTVVITPSDPPNDPSAAASPIALEDSYQIEITAYAADGVTPAPGVRVSMSMMTVSSAWFCDVYPDRVLADGSTQTGHGSWTTDAQGKVRLTASSNYAAHPGRTTVCMVNFYVANQVVPRLGHDEWDSPLPDYLMWLSPLNWSDSYTHYEVSDADVVAGGSDSGTIQVQLYSQTGPALIDPSKLTASAPPGSGLSIGGFTNAGSWADDGLPLTGQFEASFTGVKPGDWPIEVFYDGQPLSVRSGRSGIAHLIADPTSPGVPAADQSTAALTRTGGQLANHDAPGLAPSDWGRQTLTVRLADGDGRPVVDAAADLAAAASADDPLDGIGLYFGGGGVFACAQAPVAGQCPSGVYSLEVYSSKAGLRDVEVVYGAGTAAEFTVLTPAGDPSLATVFAVPPLDHAASTVVISPSTPGDDPDDPSDEPDSLPDTLAWGQTYTVQATAWDAGRHNRVPGVEISARLVDQSYPTRRCHGAELRAGGQSGQPLRLITSALGRVEFTVHATSPTTKCKLQVWTDDSYRSDVTHQFSGSGRDLNWFQPDPDPRASQYEVDQDPVTANGYDFGTIRVQMEAAVGRSTLPVEIDPAALTAWAQDPDSGLEIGPFTYESISGYYGGGVYVAQFKGLRAGDWTINVAWDGHLLTAVEPAVAVAHLVAGDVPAADPARSSAVVAGYAPRATYADTLADYAAWDDRYFDTIRVELLDAQGNPVEGASGALWVSLAAADPYGPDSYFAGSVAHIDQPGLFQEIEAGSYEVSVASFKPGTRQFKVTFAAGDLTFDLLGADDPATTSLPALFRGRAASLERSKLAVVPSTPGDDPSDPADPPDGRPDRLEAGQAYEIW
ncbi:MAG: hypothetical protein LBG60_06055, partial [Bifidobacteriaceae bacterium]|nr:hypothetical protein [Bifidobacteriaceae bacterium]